MSILIILLAVCVTVFVLFAIGVYRSTAQYSLQRRIEELTTSPEVETVEEEMQKPFSSRVILPVAEKIARKVKNLMPQQAVSSVRAKLITAGLYPGTNEMHFLGICWLMAFAFMFFSIFMTSSVLHL